VPGKVAFCAEIGLSGELRAVSRTEQRIQEAEKLGFEEIILAYQGKKEAKLPSVDIKVSTFKRVEEVFKHLFG
jgi:DNA repair protein RadA/Sms